MGTFNTHKLIDADPSLIPTMADKVISQFRAEGYEVDEQVSAFGTYDISLTKGGTFKMVLGLQTALKITIRSESGKVSFDAGIGVFGRQLIPAIVMYFVGWPVILTQVWGLVKQANLDDKALMLAESVIPDDPYLPKEVEQIPILCPNCGEEKDDSMRFCPNCGTRL